MKIVLCIFLVFAALGIACAVWIGRRRASPSADPFFHPFGEMPGFSAEQLRRLAPPISNNDPLRRSFASRPISNPAVMPDARFAAGGRPSIIPSGMAAGRTFLCAIARLRSRRHA